MLDTTINSRHQRVVDGDLPNRLPDAIVWYQTICHSGPADVGSRQLVTETLNERQARVPT